MEPIDWSKPIELMNGAPRKHEVREDSRLVWVSEILTAGFFVDCQGCIGGVQVVRNRKEKRKLRVKGWINLYESDDEDTPIQIDGPYHTQEIAQMRSYKAFASIYIDREVEEGEGL